MRHDGGYYEESRLGKAYDARLLKRLFPLSKPYRLLIISSICLVILITLMDLAVPYITKVAIDQYIVPKIDSQAFFRKKNADITHRKLTVDLDNHRAQEVVNAHPDLFQTRGRTALLSYDDLSKLKKDDIAVIRKSDTVGIRNISLLFLVVIFMNFILNFGQKIIMEYTGHMMMNDLRLTLFAQIQRLSMSFFTKNPVGRLVTRATNDIQNMHELFTSVISLVFKDMFLLIGIAIVLLLMNWKLALVSFLILPLVLYTALAFSGRIRDVFRELRIKIAEINTKISEMIEGIKVIQSYGKESITAKDFSSLNHENYLAGMRQIQVLAVFMPLIEVFGIVTVSVIIFYGGKNVLSNSISLGVLVAFISYMRMFFRPIRDLAEKYNILQNAMASAERIFLILDSDERIDHLETGKTGAVSENESRKLEKLETLIFDNVSFAYTPPDFVLENITLTIQRGKTVALVGATGSGKTSLINLVVRFYDPTIGKIMLNNRDIKEIPISELRSKTALVTQDPFLFTDTIKANILRDQPEVPDEVISRVLTSANCSDFIDQQPDGIHTVLSGGGASISSGERQLISIARALARNPELIILDEATSYIDSLTESLIQDALLKLMAGRTSLVIAHRLSTIRHADMIVVLDNGKVIEMGDHEALMAAKGYYCQMTYQQDCWGNSC